MPQLRLALCSFSYGLTDGIARMDQLLATGLANAGFSVKRFVILPEQLEERREENGISFLRLESAHDILLEEFAQSDIVQFNGSYDPCVSFAAAKAKIPVLIEVMHSPERGGMFQGIDALVCVSGRVGSPAHQSMQERARATVEAGYDKAHCAANYAALYKEFLQGAPRQRERNMPAAWMPLLQATFLLLHNPERALHSLEQFVRAGQTLEPGPLAHPNGQATILICAKLLLWVNDSTLKPLKRTFCALMRASKIHTDELAALEKSLG